MDLCRLEQSLQYGDEKRSGPDGRLNELHLGEVPVCRIADQIKNRLDDPSTGEDLAVLDLVGGSCGHGSLSSWLTA